MKSDFDLNQSKRTVLTLDAGGSHFVFSAFQGKRQILTPVTLPAETNDLDRCLDRIVQGFSEVISRLARKPDAVSFAFPGPADYPNGIIENPPNFPCFKGGVALGPFLQNQFGLPVFINNDGNLFTLGEAMAGLLPEINAQLAAASASRVYRHLIGVTFGTGLGCGIVINGELHTGDNAAAGEIWVMRNRIFPETFAEESVSIRGIRYFYTKQAGLDPGNTPMPIEIADIARGKMPGHRDAANAAFDLFGRAAGDALANAVSLVDGLIVIGGGLSGAADLFFPSMIAELNRPVKNLSGCQVPRTELTLFNLEDSRQKQKFLKGAPRTIRIPRSREEITLHTCKWTGVGLSVLGTNMAVSLGACAFALKRLQEMETD